MLHVLLADDDETVRESVAGALADAGHHVITAEDGEDALAQFSTQHFDLAIFDIRMPKLDGMTLFRRLRRESPGTAIVLMTTLAQISDAVRALRDGALDYVTKPFDPDELVRTIMPAIAERSARIEADAARDEAIFGERRAG